MLNPLWSIGKKALFRLDAETAHRLALSSMAAAPKINHRLLSATVKAPHPCLHCDVAGLKLRSPIGLAAGMDKDGEAIPVWPALGFGFIEVGTVTAHAQEGNPKPRLFRLQQEQGIINRMGFNNHGSAALAERLRELRTNGLWPQVPVGANVGKSKITPNEEAGEDYRCSIERLVDLVDYFTINVSSPNTPGLRDLQSADKLKRLLDTAKPAAKDKAVFVKFAPDMNPEDLANAIEAVIESGCQGIIGTNTTNSRPNTTGRIQQSGGLSGSPLWPLARQQIGQILERVDGRVPVIGVGGIDSAAKAKELLTLGCAAVQIYSALIYKGPGLISQINEGLSGSQ